MMLALSVGILVAGSVFLILSRGLVRIVLGFVLLGHAANLVLLASGGTSRRGTTIGPDLDPAVTADALPQAFALTAIVIAFAITIHLLVLAAVGGADDDTDEPGDADDDAVGTEEFDDIDDTADDGSADSNSNDTRSTGNGGPAGDTREVSSR